MKLSLLVLCLISKLNSGFFLHTSKQPLRSSVGFSSSVVGDGPPKKITVKVLKEMCRERGLKVSGTKQELLDRLSKNEGIPVLKDEPLGTAGSGASVFAETKLDAVIAPEKIGYENAVPRKTVKQRTVKQRLCDDDLLAELSSEPVSDVTEAFTRRPEPRYSPSPERQGPTSPNRVSGNDRFDFGPTGHDYERHSEDTSDLSGISGGIERIHTLLATRLQAKLKKNFREADKLEESLALLGVTVRERPEKTWRADLTVDRRTGRVAYTRMTEDPDTTVNVDLVNQLISDRQVAKVEKDYETADQIRAKLEEELGVILDDKRKSWVVKHPMGHPYMPQHSDLESTLSETSLKTINELLARTYKAKRFGDFNEADAAQEELRSFGVVINDSMGSLWTFQDEIAGGVMM